VQRVGTLVFSGNPYYERTREDLKQTYRSVGVEPIILEVAAQAELENAVAEASRQRAQALIVAPDVLSFSNRVLIMRSALAHRLPTIVRGREYLEAGGLVSLDTVQAEVDRSLAYFVDKILRGARPADLPIQRPTRFQMLINLKTAKALGIKIAPSLLQRADEVIE
jgi:putative ABC transport system substrate-binding protein